MLILLMVASVVGGVWLWQGRRSGIIMSRVIQALQVIGFQAGGLGYTVMIGLAALITVQGDAVGVKTQYGSFASLYWGQIPVEFSASFNVLAFALFVMLVAPVGVVTDMLQGRPERSAV
jgi:hypothetical protein